MTQNMLSKEWDKPGYPLDPWCLNEARFMPGHFASCRTDTNIDGALAGPSVN